MANVEANDTHSNTGVTAGPAAESTTSSKTAKAGLPRPLLVGALLIVLMVFLAYGPAMSGGYIWDDDFHLTENPNLDDFAGLKEIWTSPASIYYPLVLTTFWGMKQIVGLEPFPYHLLNVLLHAANALLLWAVFRRLRVPGAWLGAALFAIHPIQVDTAAWITEIKNTQSTLFLVLSLLAFLRSIEGEDRAAGDVGRVRWGWQAVALVLFVLALLSKTSTVMYPVVLAMILWWLCGRWRWRWVPIVAPYFVLSALAAAWTVWGHSVYAGVHGGDWSETPLERVLIAGRIVWFYLAKIVWPHPLMFIYPRYEVDPRNVADWLPVLAAAVAAGVLFWKCRSWGRPALMALGCYAVQLFPVLWFFSGYFTRYSYVADHFQYLSGISIFAAIGALIWSGAGSLLDEQERRRGSTRARAIVAGLLLVVFWGLTWAHARIYHDEKTLWEDTLGKNPSAWLSHYHLGRLLAEEGRTKPAIAHYETALEMKPTEDYIRINMANLLEGMNRLDQAIEQYRIVLREKPNHPIAMINLANAYSRQGQTDKALDLYARAVNLDPENAEARLNYGAALAQAERFPAAETQFAEAARLAPEAPETHFNLGLVQAQCDRTTEAIASFRRTLALEPGLIEAANQLARLLATAEDESRRDAETAVRLAQRAVAQTGRKHPRYLQTLAMAQAAAGDYARAVATAEEACARAREVGDEDLASALEEEEAHYQRNRTP